MVKESVAGLWNTYASMCFEPTSKQFQVPGEEIDSLR